MNPKMTFFTVALGFPEWWEHMSHSFVEQNPHLRLINLDHKLEQLGLDNLDVVTWIKAHLWDCLDELIERDTAGALFDTERLGWIDADALCLKPIEYISDKELAACPRPQDGIYGGYFTATRSCRRLFERLKQVKLTIGNGYVKDEPWWSKFIDEEKIEVEMLPRKYNYIWRPGGEIPSDTVILQYGGLSNFEKTYWQSKHASTLRALSEIGD